MTPNRLKRAILPLSLLTLVFLYVYACVPRPIRDLRVVQVQRLSAAALPTEDDLRQGLTERGEAVWKITLAGDSDWIGQIRKHELNSYAIVGPCSAIGVELFSVGPYQGEAKVSYGGRGFDTLSPPAGDMTYELYLPETGRYQSRADPNALMSNYDLGRQRLKLCISLAGGAMTGAYARSTEARVDVGGHR